MDWNGRIERQRKILGLSQKEASEKIGCSQAQLSLWEKGKYMPGPKNRDKIARAYGQTIEQLFF